MAIVEVAEPQVEALPNMYEAGTAGYSEENQKRIKTVDLGASALSTGADVEEVVSEAAFKSVEQINVEARESHVEGKKNELVGLVEETALNSPEALPEATRTAQEGIAALPEVYNKPYAAELNWVNSIKGSDKLTEEEKESLAVNMAFLSNVAKGLDERAWWETGHDLLGMIAVPDEAYNAAKLEALVGGSKMGVAEYLGSEESLANIEEFRRSLEPEKRFEFDKYLVEKILQVDDNRLQQLELAQSVLGEETYTEMFQTLEKLELGIGLGMPLGKRILAGLRSLNVMKRVAELGDAKAAVDIAEAAVKSPEAAIEMGVPQADAAGLGNPLTPSVFNGAPEGAQKQYRDVKVDVDEALERTTSVIAYSISPDPEVRKAKALSIEKHLSKRDDIENLNITEGIEGINIEYDMVDAEGMRTVREQVRFTKDDLGRLQQKESGFIGSTLRGVASPNILQGKDKGLLVQAPQVLDFAKSRINKAYSDAIDAAIKPISSNKKSMSNVNDMLKLMDGKDIAPTYEQLVIEGVGGKRLTDKEFTAYTSVRNVLDHAWITNNEEIRRIKELKGVKYVDDIDEGKYAVPYENANNAYAKYSPDTENNWVVKDGVAKHGIGLDEMEAHYRNGYTLVRADEGTEFNWFSSDKGQVKYALVKKGSVSELPEDILGKVPNYLPKSREGANFFVKEMVDVTVNGIKKQVPKTIAYATTEAQAIKYIQKTAKTRGERFDASRLRAVPDKEFTAGADNETAINIAGGLVHGKRKSTPLDFAGDVGEGGRTDALDVLQHYIGITADRMAMSEWRLEAQTRLMNEAASYPAIGAKAHKGSWESLRSTILEAKLPLQQETKLLNAYDQVSTMMNIPSKFDQKLQGWVVEAGKKIEKVKGGQGVAKYMYHIRDSRPTDIAKSMTFNLMLGMYNIRQIAVQLFGATVAVSINPVYATKGLPNWLLASSLDLVTNEKSAKQFAKFMGDKVGFDGEAALKDYDFWRRTGMYESVVRGNADANSVASKMPYDAGVVRRMMSGLVQGGQAPFRIGELSNMRISFFTALEREKALKGKNFKYDDVTLQNVVARTEQYRMNMGSANKAAFQKGIWALPTQFKQIYTKYIETLAGKDFTRRERLRLIMGQAGLFGLAGVPFFNHFADETISGVGSMFGFDTDKMSSEDLIKAKRGAMGLLFNDMYDLDAVVTGSLTVSADIIEDVRRAALDENTPMLKTFFGASFTTGDKIWDVVTTTIAQGNLVLDEYIEGDEPTTAMKIAAQEIGKAIANVPSSGRKALAAWYLYNGRVLDSKGREIMSKNPELRDIIVRAAGFSSQEVEDIYKLRQADYARTQDINDQVDMLMSMAVGMYNKVDKQDEAGLEASHVAMSYVWKLVNTIPNKKDRDSIRDAFHRRIMNPRDIKEETVKKAMENSFSEVVGAANNLSILKKKYEEEKGLVK